MSFICKNTDCSAPENKKGKVYPSAMECPFCDAPLVEVLSFNEADLKLINALPYVIAYPLKRAIAEKHAWTKINLLKDTFLNYLKYFGLITASEFFNSSLKDKKMVALFQQALAEPSFGSWNQYIRETLNYLKENNHHFFCPDLLAYYELVETSKKRKLFKGEIEFIDGNGDVQLKKQEATAIGMLINFRNRYLGHGLTLDEAAAKKLWDEYYPIFSLLLEQLNFAHIYPMFKHEHGETYRLQSAELIKIEKGAQASAKVWMENPEGKSMDILPFFVVPGELSIGKADKEQILAYESYTGKTIKFFSPEGTEKQTSGKILEKLNLLLRDKQKELPNTPDSFTKEVFINRIADENKLILDTLTAEKKYIPNVYVHREEMEIKLREWIGARANILFIAAEAGSGKTNLLIEMQKQYAAQNFPVLFIRAARMEKSSLKAQIAYLLNIQHELGIEHYSSIAGTQASPTFILIDGLNEAAQAASLWQEIIDISKKSIPGSLKFVVSSRANASADLNGYTLTESDEVYLYGEKKEGHTGLSAYAFWLTALNMAEMKSAWEAYGQTNKNKYKPQFSFDYLATFDRSIYNLISNPLVLRIFLETYHNKTLLKKGKKHLNIWQDWHATFSDAETSFLKLLAQAVWDKGENELLLDELLHNPNLKPFLTNDLINAPYPRLKNLGWISRYNKGLDQYLSFTIEAQLIFIISDIIKNDIKLFSLKELYELCEHNQIRKSGLREFLNTAALNEDIKVLKGWDKFDQLPPGLIILLVNPLTLFTKQFGIKKLVEDIFNSNMREDTIILLLGISQKLDLLELYDELGQLYQEINNLIDSSSDDRALLLIRGLEHDKNNFQHFTNLKDYTIESTNENLLLSMGKLLIDREHYTDSMRYFEKCLKIRERNNASLDEIAQCYGLLGVSASGKKDFELAYDFTLKAKSKYDLMESISRASIQTISNLGELCKALKKYKEAEAYLNLALNELQKYFGIKSFENFNVYNKLGLFHKEIKNYNLSIEYFQNYLNLSVELNSKDHETQSLAELGAVYFEMKLYEKAIEYYKRGFLISSKYSFLKWEADCYLQLQDFNKALKLYLLVLDNWQKKYGTDDSDVIELVNLIKSLKL